MASDPPGRCSATYVVVFTVGDVPSGSVVIDYTWHLVDGGTVVGNPITLKSNSSQRATTTENPGRSEEGSVSVSWSADGIGSKASAPVSITCLT